MALDEVFVTIQGQRQYSWRAVDQDDDVIDEDLCDRRHHGLGDDEGVGPQRHGEEKDRHRGERAAPNDLQAMTGRVMTSLFF